MYVCVRVCQYVNPFIEYIHAHMMRIYIYIHIYTDTYMYTHISTYHVHVSTHDTHTHTHTKQTQSQVIRNAVHRYKTNKNRRVRNEWAICSQLQPIVDHAAFEFVGFLCVIVNAVLLLLAGSGASQDALSTGNVVLLVVFNCEVCMYVYGYT